MKTLMNWLAKSRVFIEIFFILFCLSAPASAVQPSAATLLEKADRARGGLSEGLLWSIAIDSTQDGEVTHSQYSVQVKGTNVLASCTAPPRQKGETFLFNDRNLWVYRPGLRKPVSVSPRQRLSGQAANGDIATTNYARDYTGEVVGNETINGVKTFKLQLKAKSKDVTYDGITYWVSQDKFLGVQAEFLGLDGKPFKRAKFEYSNSINAGGSKIPFVSQMHISDVAFPKNTTSLKYENPKAATLSDSIFNANNLAR